MRYTIYAIIALVTLSQPVFARDERCSQLEQLAVQYANVVLTASQKAFKHQAIAWYSKNCKKVALR